MGRAVRNKMRKTWFGSTTGTVISLSAQQIEIMSIGVGAASLHGVTLLRSRGELLVSGSPDAATDITVVGLGLIVVSEAAQSQGGLSIPGPINDVDADWLWHKFVPLDAVSATAVDFDNTFASVRVELDSKAMRRVPTDSTVILVGEANTSTFPALTVIGGMRLLFGT